MAGSEPAASCSHRNLWSGARGAAAVPWIGVGRVNGDAAGVLDFCS